MIGRCSISPFSLNVSNTDTDALAFITAAGITDSTQKTAINNLVVELKSNSLYNLFDAIYPFVGGSASAHKFNLINPVDTDGAFRLTFSGGWTHSATGMLGNGSDTCAQTHYIPSVNYSLTAATLSIYSRTERVDSYDIGAYETGVGIHQISSRLSGDLNRVSFLDYNGSYSDTANTSSLGLFTAVRAAGNSKSFINGTKIRDSAEVNVLPTIQLCIGSTNLDGVTTASTAREYAFAALSSQNISDANISLFYTSVQNFQTALNRQV